MAEIWRVESRTMRVGAWVCAHPKRLAAAARPAAAPVWPAFLRNRLLETDCIGASFQEGKFGGERGSRVPRKRFPPQVTIAFALPCVKPISSALPLRPTAQRVLSPRAPDLFCGPIHA